MLVLSTLLLVYVSFYYVQPYALWDSLQNVPIFYWLGVVSSVAIVSSFVSKSTSFFRYKTNVMMLGLLVAMMFSHVADGYVGGALKTFSKFFPMVVAYFLVVQSLVSMKRINAFVVVLILLTTFLGYEAILQSVTGFSDGGLSPLYERKYNPSFAGEEGVDYLPRARWFGTFNDPNDLGLALIVVVPLLVSRLLRKKYLLAIACLPIVLWGIYLTNSRGAFLSLAISIASYIIVRFRSMRVLFVGAIVLLLLLLFLPSRMSSLSDESSMGRLEAWYAGLQMLKSHPLFGIGAGNFTDYHVLTAHNSFVLVLAELGVFGSFFFVGLFFIPLRWAIKNIFKQTENHEIEARRDELGSLFGGLVGVLCSMFFLSRAYAMVPYVVVGLISAYVNVGCCVKRDKDSDLMSSNFQVRNITLCIMMEIVLIFMATRTLL